MRDRTTVVDAYIDAASPQSVKSQRIDNAYSKLSEGSYLLLDAAQSLTLVPPVSKEAAEKANKILSGYLSRRMPPSITQPIVNDKESSVLFQCFLDTCPPGGPCHRINAKHRSARLVEDIRQQRAFFNETAAWARAARRPVSEQLALRREFLKALHTLRNLTARPPQEIFVWTNRVPR